MKLRATDATAVLTIVTIMSGYDACAIRFENTSASYIEFSVKLHRDFQLYNKI